MGLRDRLRDLIGRSPASAGAGDHRFDDPETMARALMSLEVKLGYEFRNQALLARALVHRSHTHVAGKSRSEANERLEFLGDAVLELVVNEHLYRTHPEFEEGDLTKMKSQLVCGKSLSEVAKRLELGEHILMSRGEASTGGRTRSSILADAVEAVIGAVYLDGGLEPARKVIRAMVLRNVERIADDVGMANFKSRLQEVIQARHKVPPRYRVREVTGPDHDRSFTVEVLFRGVPLGAGRGPSKKDAEQKAAAEALDRIEADPELIAGDTD